MKLHFTKTGHGPALVILHGLYGQGENWMNIARELSDSFTVYLPDQRNHGKSPHSPSHSYADMVSDLAGFCKAEALTSIVLLGHSMGGKTAMAFALQHPEVVYKLIVVDISPYSYQNQPGFELLLRFHQIVPEAFINAPIDTAHTRNEVEGYFARFVANVTVRRFLLKNLKRSTNGGFYWQLNANAISKNIFEILDAIPQIKLGLQNMLPALFVRGGKSPYISIDDMDAIPDIFPNASFVTFENAGHWLHAEEPERFVSAVKNFI
ncbi:MAG: alpha/beta fold hydrolase [Bacteroidales bacterium]|nr:alpha/beta fold hydrolase [Bacteroidales bacterium]